MTSEPTVFIVDDDDAVRDALEWLVGSVKLKAETYASAREFLAACDPAKPGCLVLDVRMPRVSGLRLQEKLAKKGITLPIIFITGFGDVPTAVRAMKNGAVDFIEKPFNNQFLLELVERCIERDSQERRDATRHSDLRARFSTLTKRQREVFDLIVAGVSNADIADRLKLSIRTVEIHRASVMRKMKATSLAKLVEMAGNLRRNP